MATWRPDLGKSGTRARALVEALRDDIASGLLKPGDRLPPQRTLAYDLGLSPNTVMRAYAEAASRGYVGGEVGRGTYVRAPGEAAADGGAASLSRAATGPIDFSLNLPFLGGAGEALERTLADLVRAGGLSGYLDHEAEEVAVGHRRAGAAWVGRLGLAAEAERIVPTNGAQQGLSAALLAILRPGELLLTETLTYAPLKALARRLGLRLAGVEMDGEGLLPEALEAACRQGTPRALYCTPTLQTPTAATMGEARRRAVARIAAARDLLVIEDDVFGFLPADRPPPLAVFAPERTFFVTGLSKSAAPGLRVGYVHAPGRWAAALQSCVNLSSWMPPPLMGEIAARWIGDGTADRLNADQRAHAERRQSMARRLLGDRVALPAARGLHLWLTLPAPWSADAFAAAAERAGVLLQPASRFMAGGGAGPVPAAVRLCLSHEVSDRRVGAGLAILADLLDCDPDAEAIGP